MDHFFAFLNCSYKVWELWKYFAQNFYDRTLAFTTPVQKIAGHSYRRRHALVHFTCYLVQFALQLGGKMDHMVSASNQYFLLFLGVHAVDMLLPFPYKYVNDQILDVGM